MTSSERRSVVVDCFGIGVCVEAVDLEFAAFVERNYRPFISKLGENTQIFVRFSPKAGEAARAGSKVLDIIGPGVAVSHDRLYWSNPFGFVAMFQVQRNGTLEINGFHFGLLNSSSQEELLRNYQRSMRWMVHFPIFILLRERGIHLTHASAVASPGGAMVFCGHGGVGKSTLAMAFIKKRHYKHMADNFLLGDDRRLYGFPECCRLDLAALQQFGICRSTADTVYGKTQVALQPSAVMLEAVPRACILITNGTPMRIETIPAARAARIVGGIHRLIGEFPEHSPLALLCYLDRFKALPDPAIAAAMCGAPWFHLRMPKDWVLDDTLDKLESCI